MLTHLRVRYYDMLSIHTDENKPNQDSGVRELDYYIGTLDF